MTIHDTHHVAGISVRPHFALIFVTALLALCFCPNAHAQLDDLRYDFELSEEGFAASDWHENLAVTSVEQTASASYNGNGSLQLNMELEGQSPTHGAGEAWVDMRWYPPPIVRAPFDLAGEEVSVYVWCPAGAGGSPSYRNGLQLFVKDTNWVGQYGSWTEIVEETWQKVSITPTTAGGLDPHAIHALGIKIGANSGWAGTYNGPIYVDAFCFPADAPEQPQTEHLYDFNDPAGEQGYPFWYADPNGWDAQAWTNVYVDTGVGALAADAVFSGEGAPDEERKGVFVIEYNPALNLSTKDHRVIQAKLKFDPPVEGILDFDALLAVFDKKTDQWYTKMFKVGCSDWNILEFDLDDPDDYYEGAPVPMDSSSIGFVAVQVYANIDYTGQILLDDVVVGGNEESGHYDPIQGGIVYREGSLFMLDDLPYYFCGANIEYITQVTVNDSLADQLLASAADMHIRVVRTWAFHEGFPYSFQPEPGVWNESAFEKLDRIVAMAGDHNIRLMLGLVDNWGHNGGMFKYMEWVLERHPESLPPELQTTNALGSIELHDEFYVNEYAKQWYRDYVTKLLTRTNTITGVAYSDDPTIFGWEIVNEPRCATEMSSGRPFGTWVHNWICEMSDFVRTIDANHMLAAGEEGGYITTFEDAASRTYQTYPRNYWEYGLQAATNWGAGAMADFISDYASEDTYVEWQTGIPENPGPVQGEWRAGVTNVDFCPFRLYIDDKEYNLHQTNYIGFDQRREWLAEHTYDAHEVINKPLILEEFGFHAFGWAYQGYYGELQYVPIPEFDVVKRVQQYSDIYEIIEDIGMNGSFFWNLGYEGLWEDPWDLCEDIGNWTYYTDSDATGISLDSTYVIQGSNSLRLAFDSGLGYGKAIYNLTTNEQWLVRLDGDVKTGVNRVKFFWNVFNPGTSVDVALVLRVGDGWDWYESEKQVASNGWTEIMFNLSAGTWMCEASGWQHTEHLIDVLDDVREIVIAFYGDNGQGAYYLDDITIKRDDGFVIYPSDPVVDVIRAHADHMNAKGYPGEEGPVEDIRYDFETGAQGWVVDAGTGITSVQQTTDEAFIGLACLQLNLNLTGVGGQYGEAEVDMAGHTPEGGVSIPANLSGQPVRISVYCPPGSAGSGANPNRIRIYVEDMEGDIQYSTFSDIAEERWVTLMLVPSSAGNFNAEEIGVVGCYVECGGAASAYTGPIYMDAVRFPVIDSVLYGFSSDLQGWGSEDWGYGHANVSWTDAGGNPRAGAMSVGPAAGEGFGKYYVRDYDLLDNVNLVYKPILRTYIWVPADAPVEPYLAVRVKLYLRSSSDGWTYDNFSDQFFLTPGTWNLLTWDMSYVPAEVLADADEFGLEIIWSDRTTWNGAVLVDSIHALAVAPMWPPSITSVQAESATVGQYEKFELTVDLANVVGLNPFDPDSVDLQATFTSPSATPWTINGFYMEEEGDALGAGKWKIRFAPDELGQWDYEVTVSNNKGTDTSVSDSFSCIAGDRHGWIRVSDDDSHYLEHDDDTPFLGIGYCRAWDGDDEGFFMEAEEHGINMIHWWMAPWDTMLTAERANQDEWWHESSSYDTYEQGRAMETDRVINHAEKHSVKLVFTIWPHDAIRDFNYHKWRINGSWQKAFDEKFSEPEWFINAFSRLDDPPKNQKFFYDAKYKKYQEHLYRYIIARWGYSEAIGCWALASEMFGTFADSVNCIHYQDPAWVDHKTDLFGEDPYLHMDTEQSDGNDYTISWLTCINDYFKSHDPFGHPTTASYGTDEYWADGFPVIDMPQIHTYADLYSWITPPVTVSKYHKFLWDTYNKPAFMGEIGTVDWKKYEPDYARVTTWPAICSGAAITPMMWTTPPFSWFGDAKMGPWLEVMSDEMKVLARFIADIDFHQLNLQPVDASATKAGAPAPSTIEGFEGGVGNWTMHGPGITSVELTPDHATEGSQCLRMNIDMDTWANMPNPESGVEIMTLNEDWSDYWPDGTLKVDMYIPEFYRPDTHPDGMLLGINKDPRSIVEIAVEEPGGGWNWYSTQNEYVDEDGWKKLTVGMLWNLELKLSEILTEYEAERIRGIKIWFGNAGILRGPVYIDNMTAGLYPFNTHAMMSADGTFAFGWIQDRRWADVVTSNATFQISGLAAGSYNLEWWDTLNGISATCNADAPSGTLSVQIPDFTKDVAVKIRRIGAVGATVHDVAVGNVQEYDWIVRNASQPVDVLIVNQGSVSETFDVTLTDSTDAQLIGTESVTLAAGVSDSVTFTWDCTSASLGEHTLTAVAVAVPGETDTDDNQLVGKTIVHATEPPWDPCDRLRRWAPDVNDSDARTLVVSTNYVSEGNHAFELYYRSPEKLMAYFGFDQVYEDWSDNESFVLDMYNAADATGIKLLMRNGANWDWYYSAQQALTPGWNYDLTFAFADPTWTKLVWNEAITNFDYYYDVPLGGLEEIQQLFIEINGYTDEGLAYFDNMRLIPGAPPNQPPAVNAGSDQWITLPADANLDGAVTDDGLPDPPGVTTVQWTQVSGPDTAIFGDASAEVTTASFPTNGEYALRLTAYDGELSTYDEVAITVFPTSTVPPIDFNGFTILSYGGQDLTPTQYEILDSGFTLHLWGNTWKAIALPYNATPNTVIEFDFMSDGTQGEINGIGLDENLGLSSTRIFEIYGTQTWGIQGYRNYPGSGWKHYVIPVGQHYTGNMQYLVLVCDADAGQNTSIYYKNVQVYEKEPEVPTEVAWEAKAQLPASSWYNSGVHTKAFRVLLDGDFVTNSGGKVYLTLKGRTSGDYAVQRVSLVRRDGTTVNGVDETFAQVTFGGGAWDDGGTVPAGGTLRSDLINFDLIEGEDVFMTCWVPANNPTVYRIGGSQTMQWETTADHSTTIDWEGLSFSAQRPYIYVAYTLEAAPADPVPAWHSVEQNPGSWGNSGWNNRTYRVLVRGEYVTNSGGMAYLALQGRSGSSYTVHRVSLVERDGAGLNGVDSTFAQVTFDGGAWDDGVTIPANGTARSDPIDFALLEGQDLFVTFWADAVNPTVYRTGGTQGNTTWTIANTDHTSTIDWDGLTISGANSHIYGALLLEAVPGGLLPNREPEVNAGPNQEVTLPADATLDGTVTDDGLPHGSTLDITWSKVSGPGTVIFADEHEEDTTASFSIEGAYVLRLTAYDGEFSVTDDITIHVLPAGSLPPVMTWEAEQQNPGTTWNNSGVQNRAFRILLDGNFITDSGGRTYLTLKGRSSGDYTVQRVSLVTRDGTTLNGIDETFAQVTFGDSWDAGGTMPAGGTLRSDPIDFDVVEGQDVFMTCWVPANNATVYRTGGSQTEQWETTADNSTTIDWEGLSFSAQRSYIYVAFSLETAPVNQAPNVDAGLDDTVQLSCDEFEVTDSMAVANPAPNYKDYFGLAAAAVGNDKFVVGTQRDDTAGTNAGSVYLYDNAGVLLLSLANPEPGVDDYFGNAVAGLGIDRFLVGAYYDDNGGYNAGSVYLFDTAGMPLLTITNPISGTYYFGAAVAGMGSDKIVVGRSGGYGAAHVFDTSGALLATVTNPAGASWDNFGACVAAVGSDMFVVGAYYDDTATTNAGIAYLYDTSGALLATFDNPNPDVNDYFGSAVAGVGSDKVLIGAKNDDMGAAEAGVAYLFDTSGTLLVTITNPAQNTYDYFGNSVGMVSSDRLIVGARSAAPHNTGAAHIFALDGTHLLSITNPLLDWDAAFGSVVAGVGTEDFVVAAPYSYSGGSGDLHKAGKVHLYSFKPESTALNGTVTDDGLPDPPSVTTVQWTKESGPGTAYFAEATEEDTAVRFSTTGTYVLKLTADDSALTGSDTVTITVQPMN